MNSIKSTKQWISNKDSLEYFYKELEVLKRIKFKNGNDIEKIKQCVQKIEIIKASIETYRKARSRRIISKIKRIFND